QNLKGGLKMKIASLAVVALMLVTACSKSEEKKGDGNGSGGGGSGSSAMTVSCDDSAMAAQVPETYQKLSSFDAALDEKSDKKFRLVSMRQNRILEGSDGKAM